MAEQQIYDVILQWGRGLSTPEIGMRRAVCCRHTPFNGAGVFRPRKSAGEAVQYVGDSPSMGPGSFDPGNTKPGLMRSWPASLQWGRGLSTPEIAQIKYGKILRDEPSMGPGSFDPGNSPNQVRQDSP